MRDKLGIAAGIGIALSVVVTLLLWMAGAGDLDIGESVPVGIAAILVASATYLLWDRMKNVRRGLPAKDERLIEQATTASSRRYGAQWEETWQRVSCSTSS